MSTATLITAAVTGLLSAGALVIAVFQFRGRGPAFTNTYLLASPKEREKLDLKAEYRLGAVVFSAICALFALVTVGIVLELSLLFTLAVIGGVLLALYAVLQAVQSGKFR